MIYLASPYTDPDREVREDRARAAAEYAAHLTRKRVHVISPIVHGHALVSHACDLPVDFAFWRSWSLTLIDGCNAVHVLTLPGWRGSAGVTEEIEYARGMNMRIAYAFRDPHGHYRNVFSPSLIP